jgi:hypothetical protein
MPELLDASRYIYIYIYIYIKSLLVNNIVQFLIYIFFQPETVLFNKFSRKLFIFCKYAINFFIRLGLDQGHHALPNVWEIL